MSLCLSMSGTLRGQEAISAPAAPARQESSSKVARRTVRKEKLEPGTVSRPRAPQPELHKSRRGEGIGVQSFHRLGKDQAALWTNPGRGRFADLDWLVPLAGLTAGLLVTDRDASRHLSNSPKRLDRSRQVSNFGTAAMVSAAGGLYLWGKATHDEHRRETGLLSGEALVNAIALATVVKYAAGRERPRADNGAGKFRQGGSSFPSNHAAAAWSVASVVAHEYPGPLTKLLAYGLASAVSTGRVTGKEHFSSDVLIGSAIGWFVGQQVYRAHHKPELGGGTWETPAERTSEESRQRPSNMGSPYVPLDSWVYSAFDRLAALGYVQSAMLGMRPWTRLECARLVGEAADNLSEDESAAPEATRLQRGLEKEFADDLKRMGSGRNRVVRLESVYAQLTGISGAPLTDGYHFGQTIINNYGRPYEEGVSGVAGFSAQASADRFAVYVRGEYQHAPAAPALSDAVREVIAAADLNPVQPATPFSAVNRFRLLDSYVAWNLENWQVSFGRQSLWWGPGKGGPLLVSNNAAPILSFRISRVAPFQLPSIFRWLGPMRMDSFFGQFEGHRFPANAVIHGQKISFKPTPNLEFGFSRTVVLGGTGHPLTLGSFSRSFFSVGDNPDTIPGSSKDVGDRRGAFDFSYRVPGLRNWLVLYGDSLVDDDPSPLAAPRRAAMNPGIYLPRLPRLPKLDFRAEAVYTDVPTGRSIGGKFIYWNSAYHDSHTNGGNLLGSWVGREGMGFQLWSTYWLSPQDTVQVSYRHGKVNPDFIRGGGTLNDVTVHANLRLRENLSLSTNVQYERWLFPVLSPGAQSNVATSIQVTYWPREGGKWAW